MLGATTAHREEAATNVRIGCINVCGYTGLGLANCAVAPARAQFIARYGPSNRLRSKPVRWMCGNWLNHNRFRTNRLVWKP